MSKKGILIGAITGGLIGFLINRFNRWWCIGYLQAHTLTIEELLKKGFIWSSLHEKFIICYWVLGFPLIALAMSILIWGSIGLITGRFLQKVSESG